MILQRLAEHYDRIVSVGGDQVPRAGWSLQKVSFCVVLELDGTLNSFQSLLDPDGRRLRPHEFVVPGQSKPSGSGFKPCFLWDSSQYMLGYKKDDCDPARTRTCFEAFRDRHLQAEARIHDPAFTAVCAFLRAWSPERAEAESKLLANITSSFGVFRLAGATAYVHDQLGTAVDEIINEALDPEAAYGMCLVTGRIAQIARLHEPKIKGVSGAQSAGALLVSFNASAYESYGKTQSYNAPVSAGAAFKYTNALNHLLNDKQRRISLGDATIVFWAERRHPLEEFVSDLLGDFRPPDTSSAAEDQERLRQTRQFLTQLRDGVAEAGAINRDSQTRFFILGLSPNASRISVRFWIDTSAGELERRLGQHLRDIEIMRRRNDLPLTLRHLVAAMGRAERDPNGKFKRFNTDAIPHQLIGDLARSVLTGGAYPQSLLSSMLQRIRRDGEVHPARVAAIKGCLVRNARLRGDVLEVSVELDPCQSSPAYNMGRLFALLEKIQADSAESELNTTIKDHYFSAAGTTPAVVFPRLFRLSQHHQAKLSTGARIFYEKLLGEVMAYVHGFPPQLAIEDQGKFVIGYYQQRQELFTRKAKAQGASE